MENTTSNLKNVVRFTDGNETSRTPFAMAHTIEIVLAGGYELVVDTSKLTDIIIHQAMLHGLKQKLVDSVAGKAGKEAHEALKATAEMLLEGNWTRPREGGGSSSTTLLVEAMMRVFNKSKEDCELAVEKHDAKELAKVPAIAAMILTIKAERAAAKAKVAGKASDVDSDFNPFA